MGMTNLMAISLGYSMHKKVFGLEDKMYASVGKNCVSLDMVYIRVASTPRLAA